MLSVLALVKKLSLIPNQSLKMVSTPYFGIFSRRTLTMALINSLSAAVTRAMLSKTVILEFFCNRFFLGVLKRTLKTLTVSFMDTREVA